MASKGHQLRQGRFGFCWLSHDLKKKSQNCLTCLATSKITSIWTRTNNQIKYHKLKYPPESTDTRMSSSLLKTVKPALLSTHRDNFPRKSSTKKEYQFLCRDTKSRHVPACDKLELSTEYTHYPRTDKAGQSPLISPEDS